MVRIKGQATFEFLFTLVFSLGFIYLFFQLAINSGIGFLLHHTSYLASRSYLVFDDNNRNFDASDRAAEGFITENVILKQGLQDLGVSAEELTKGIIFNAPGGDVKYEYVGVKMVLKRVFSPFSMMGTSQETRMISESFLGREPTRGTCLRRICEYVFDQHLGFQCDIQNDNHHITAFDNGC